MFPCTKSLAKQDVFIIFNKLNKLQIHSEIRKITLIQDWLEIIVHLLCSSVMLIFNGFGFILDRDFLCANTTIYMVCRHGKS